MFRRVATIFLDPPEMKGLTRSDPQVTRLDNRLHETCWTTCYIQLFEVPTGSKSCLSLVNMLDPLLFQDESLSEHRHSPFFMFKGCVCVCFFFLGRP